MMALVAVVCFCCCANSQLKDITKPYLGEYECKSVTLGGRDMLDSFTSIKLYLQPDDTFLLSYKTKLEEVGQQKGTYSYNKEEGSIVFSSKENGGLQRAFPIKNGAMDIVVSIAGKQLHVQFIRK